MAKFCGKCGKDLSKTNGVCPDCKGVPKYSVDGRINRALLKEEAKKRLSGNLINLWKPFFVVFAISLVYTLLFNTFIGEDNVFSIVIELIFSFVTMPMVFGAVLYYLKFVRGEDFKISDLFEFYDKRILTIFSVSFLVGLFTVLWSFLFIIPGIIAAISYAMYTNIYVDNTVGDHPLEVIRESKRLMNGYKGDYFVFNLSFIGWVLLGVVSFGIALIYVLPYVTVAETMYYEELKAIKEN